VGGVKIGVQQATFVPGTGSALKKGGVGILTRRKNLNASRKQRGQKQVQRGKKLGNGKQGVGGKEGQNILPAL